MFSGIAENCRRRGKKVAPFFPEKKRFSELAAAVLELRADAVAKGRSRGDGDEEMNFFRQGLSPSEAIVAAGLDKIVVRAMEWQCGSAVNDLPAIREKLFCASAEWRRMSGGDFGKFIAVRDAAPEYIAFHGGRCYGDLPEADIAAGMGEAAGWTPEGLTLRYRLEAWQSLLLKAGRITLDVTADNAQQLRRLLRRMRFHRLLGRIVEGGSGHKMTLRMEISGPADIFSETRKYGMNLACFFPAVTLMPGWKLECHVKYKEHDCTLSVDREEAALGNIAARSGGGAYEPEEFTMFRENFVRQGNSHWQLCEDVLFFKDRDGTLIIPDFIFSGSDGRYAAVELFHLWHSSRLVPRLKWLQNNLNENFIIGIDRRILPKGTMLENFLEGFPGLAGRVFLYRDYPGAATVAKLLNSLC